MTPRSLISGTRNLSRARREQAGFKASMRAASAKPIPVVVEDLSVSGFCAQWPHHAQVGDKLWLRLPGLESLAATVIWTSDFKIGCRFDHPLHPVVFEDMIDIRRRRPRAGRS